MKKLFIGIDYSKQSFSVSAFEMDKKEEVNYEEFENNRQGFLAFLKWATSITSIPLDRWLICGEHTGLYSIALTTFLLKKNLFVWLENPLQITTWEWNKKREKR